MAHASTAVEPPPSARVPQQARSVATRLRLLEATVETLVECGWAATTTTEVGRRAGVSQGAIFKHFPNKSLLIAASIEHLFTGLIEDFRESFEAVRGEQALADAIRILWEIFRDARLQGAFELYLAARTDADLRSALAPVLVRHRATLYAEAARLFPAAADDPDFASAVDVVLNALQGAALSAIALSDPEAERAQLAQVERWARRELGQLGQPPGD
ncbi:MAG: TetR/AcrR family transcriptional regulator [Myxococcota bacterium]